MFFTLIALIIAQTVPAPGNSPPRQLNNLASNYLQNTLIYTTQTGSPSSSNYMPSNPVTQLLGQYLQTNTEAFGLNQNVVNVTDFLPNGQSYSQFQDYALYLAGNTSGTQAIFNRHYLVGVDIAPTSWGSADVTAFFNGQAYHSVVEAYATATNMIYSAYSNGGIISITNAPLPRSSVCA